MFNVFPLAYSQLGNIMDDNDRYMVYIMECVSIIKACNWGIVTYSNKIYFYTLGVVFVTLVYDSLKSN